MKKIVITALLALTLSASTIQCRGLGYAVAHVAVHAAAAAIVTAIQVAVWYSLVHPVVLYPAPNNPEIRYQCDAGSRIYITHRSADGYWCYVKTSDGRAGWTQCSRLSGHVR